MSQVLVIEIVRDGYQQIIYVKADSVKVEKLCSFDELDEAEQQLFGNTNLGEKFAVFDWESLD